MSSIAIIGASNNREKYGNKAVRAYASKGYTVYPVNPREKEIEGLQTFSSILDIPETPDLASLYLPPAVGMSVLEDMAKKGVKKFYVNPGADSPELVARAKELGMEPLLACSIVAIDVDPHTL